MGTTSREWPARPAEALYRHGFYPGIRPIAAMKACVQIAAGDLTFAAWWVHDRGFSVDDDADYLREYEHLTPPRLLLAQHHAEQSRDHAGAAAPAVGVLGLLDRLHAAATDAGRDRSVLEIRVLQALTHQADGDQPAALAAPWVGRPSRRAICACTWTKAPG